MTKLVEKNVEKNVEKVSDNVKMIINAIGLEKKTMTIEELKNITKKSSQCLIATASAKNNTKYITYTSKQIVVDSEGNKHEEKANITLTTKAIELLQQEQQTTNNEENN